MTKTAASIGRAMKGHGMHWISGGARSRVGSPGKIFVGFAKKLIKHDIYKTINSIFLSCSSSDDIDYNLPDVRDFNENKIGNPVITITRKDIPLVKAKSKILIEGIFGTNISPPDIR